MGRSGRYRLRNRRRRRSALRVGTRRTATGRARVPGVPLSPFRRNPRPTPAKCARGQKVHFGVRSPAENALNFATASTVYRPSVRRAERGFCFVFFYIFFKIFFFMSCRYFLIFVRCRTNSASSVPDSVILYRRL